MDSNSISKIEHKERFGPPLFNSFITTDFADAQTELVTPVFTDHNELISFLRSLHKFALDRMSEEYFWPFSIPSGNILSSDIKIANFGNTNKANFKEIYRKGLSNRYGKAMQAISGVHFNFSLTESFWNFFSEGKDLRFRSNIYFRAIRNLQRYNWLILYLFGCSPIIGKELIDNKYDFSCIGRNEHLSEFSTSLRMSTMGYQAKSQSKLFISINSLDQYISDLKNATNTLSDKFASIDDLSSEKWKQLNANILQVEDEYYGISRPKSSSYENQRQISKLSNYGVDYIEFRALDLNPFSEVGICEKDLKFMEAFLIFCILDASPKINSSEFEETLKNTHDVSIFGRKKDLQLERNGQSITLFDWGAEILDKMSDLFLKVNQYQLDFEKYKKQLSNPELTLSGRFLSKKEELDKNFSELGEIMGKEHRNSILNQIHDDSISKIFETEAMNAERKFTKKELMSEKPFDDYLREFLSS
ncbi:MAG: hypothetical protein CMP44_04730 [Rickettsiales bacterium]|nr:hypothetical protein [Rickettsiales bacterium]|tara:strand:+ start:1034 stop:2458 length:1425 start_codon:yes stop_codon:yes gene_type:complete